MCVEVDVGVGVYFGNLNGEQEEVGTRCYEDTSIIVPSIVLVICAILLARTGASAVFWWALRRFIRSVVSLGNVGTFLSITNPTTQGEANNRVRPSMLRAWPVKPVQLSVSSVCSVLAPLPEKKYSEICRVSEQAGCTYNTRFRQ